MKNIFSVSMITTLSSRFIQASAGWLAARWLDALIANVVSPDFSVQIAEVVFIGFVFALSALSFSTRSPRCNSMVSITFGMVVFLIPLLIWMPDVSARALVLFYAVALVIDVFVSRILPFRQSSILLQRTRLAEYLNTVPYAIFVIAALSMIVLIPFLLFLSQSLIAERISRWAFGFLMLGTSGALLARFKIPARLESLARQTPEVTFGLLIFVLLTVAYLLGETSHVSPAVIFYTEIQPNNLEGQVKDSDMIISTSPSLQLGRIRNIGKHLNLDPTVSGIALWDNLVHELVDTRRVFWVSVPNELSKAQQTLSAFLQTNGCLNEVVNSKLSLRVYELRPPFMRPSVLVPLTVDWQDIQLTGVAFAQRVCNHDAIAVAARWQLAQPSRTPLKVSWLVLDAKERQIQAQDSFLVDSAQRQTDHWIVDSAVTSEYFLPIPFGTPPGSYSLAVAVYPANNPHRLWIADSTGVVTALPNYGVLGTFQVYRPDNLTGDPYKTIQEMALVPARIELQDGLRLDSYMVDRAMVMPGDNVSVIALWQSLRDGLPKYQVYARLIRGNQMVVETMHVPVDNTFTTDQWRANEFVLDRFELRVPPATSGGMTRLEIGIVGDRMIYLADVDVAPVDHNFNLPTQICSAHETFAGVGKLIGCELPLSPITPQNQLTATLQWQANAKPTIDQNYVVFVQLIASDGHLIAQSDAMPAQGQRPTSGWIDGEIVLDHHMLEWIDANYRGTARWIVGLYDPTTLERVPVLGADEFAVTIATVHIID